MAARHSAGVEWSVEGEEGQNVHPRVAPDSAESDPGSRLTVNPTDC